MLYSAALPYQPDASVYFAAIRHLPWAAWLDSGGSGRFDILVADPVATITTRGESTEIVGNSGNRTTQADPFAVLREELGDTLSPLPDIPFAGGVLGYWSYDLARRYNRIPELAKDAERVAEMAVGIFDWAVIVDHQQHIAHLVSRQRFAQTLGVLPQILEHLLSAIYGESRSCNAFRVNAPVVSNLTYTQYQKAFGSVTKYLHEGDCYQVNLAQRFAAPAEGDAYCSYLELRKISPAPYSAFLDWPQLQILCASPERFLHIANGKVETRPIKGTRPRDKDPEKDAMQALELSRHPKDRAENLMIVDLLRNDLGKSCVSGSVLTPSLFKVESFSNVHHLVSTVTGQLKNGCDALDVLRDCFPGGSITGAPKQRAMEIIEQLEPHRRGIYCGAIGYVGFDGNMDSNIAIRTLVFSNREVRCWAGGGIVADSKCESEYQETLDKASGMLEILRCFGEGITPKR